MIKQAIRRKKTEIKYGFYEKIIHELNNQNYCIAIDEQLQILLLLNNWLSLKKEKEVLSLIHI